MVTDVPSPQEPLVLNNNGAWCWFQDERALIDPANNSILVGSVASPEGSGGPDRGGNIELAVLDLATGERQVHVLHEHLEADDHNAPALLIRPDGRYLAMYAKHKTDNFSRWRVSVRPHDASEWEPEQQFDWTELANGRGATYSNLHHLSVEGRAYNFVRAINDDPTLMISDDDGSTWSYGGKLFTRPKIGYVNGYTRYVSNGTDRIDLITTDHHPRDFNNSVYHGFIQGDALHDSEGNVASKPVIGSAGINQTTLTTVFEAGMTLDGDTLTHGWTTDLRRQGKELAAIVTCRANDVNGPLQREQVLDVDDHRLLYGRFDGVGWKLHPLAVAGPGLLPHEQDYTGLGAVDPNNLDLVYISTPIDPRTAAATAHYEIYRGVTSDAGASWTWEAVTEGSGVDNLRPMVVPGDASVHAVCWFRGSMKSSQAYETEVVLRRSDS
ncbi:BNR repeat-containing protein [Paenarthrobacter aurescens]|uniref:BNR repeat-containing protein n=1 Tax=Paenarthrobacter aurescens TaxID=43663 RepID=UPI0021C15F7F|nr:BNR repeat-containing protein [Paenarthrobacter aurescens]MCT9871356.1 BNR repeat-containing protein [Paenarthrobacter aurescens]